MDFAEAIRGIFGGQSPQAPPPGDDYAAPLRPMVDPAARTRAVGGSPEFQGKVDETLRDALREGLEPFKQVGRAVSGRSDNPVPEGLLGGLGTAMAIPGGIAKGALKAGAKLGGEALEDIIAPAAKKAATGGVGDMIKAYHGSPHDFERFDLSKIGTGEGAQAYGHGLYFAENEGVAKGYRDNLSSWPAIQKQVFNPDGTPNRPGQVAEWMSIRGSQGKPETELHAQLKAIAPEASEEQRAKWIDEGRTIFEKAKSSGRMYEVGIRANPEHFLDWDKPLSEQPEKIQDALLGARYKGDKEAVASVKKNDDFMSRSVQSHMYDLQHEKILGSPEKATTALREAGIPGIKYLDQGSRGKGDGTRNYVVFDDKLIDILKKYGIAGIGALPAMNAFHYQDKQ